MATRKKQTKRTRWTDEQVDMLKELYADNYGCDVAMRMGLPLNAVYHKAYSLGLKKSEAFRKMDLEKQADRLRKYGVATRIKKGNTPLNKGKKISKEIYEKVKATMFKKGHTPANEAHDGAIKVRTDKRGVSYMWIRISVSNWEMLHVNRWKEVYGDIPKGYILVFKDKNPMNCVVENLELITKADNMKRNMIHQYPVELQKTIKTLNKLKKTIYEKQD